MTTKHPVRRQLAREQERERRHAHQVHQQAKHIQRHERDPIFDDLAQINGENAARIDLAKQAHEQRTQRPIQTPGATRPPYQLNPKNWNRSEFELLKIKLRTEFNKEVLPTVTVTNGRRNMKELSLKWREFLAEKLEKGEIDQSQYNSCKTMMG